MTKLAGLVTAIAERLGVAANADPEMEEVKKDVAPEAVLDEIETRQASGSESVRSPTGAHQPG